MPVEGIDFAWTKPTADQAKNVGAHWAAGYYSTDPTKNLTRSLVSSYVAASLPIVGVWETSTTRATQGRQAGVADAHAAVLQQAVVGIPSGTPIHFAVDEDTSWASVADYFAGAASVLGQELVGVYGGFHVIEGAAAAGYRYLWQTVAWSGGQWSAHATIRQENGTLFAGSADYDYAEAVDFGQYPRPEVAMPLTPADAALVASTLLNTPVPDLSLPDGHGGYKSNNVIQLFERATQRHNELVGDLTALKADVDKLSSPTLTDAQVQALAAQIAPVLIPQLLAALGHALDGGK